GRPMIAAWMLYCVACAAWLGLAALGAERALLIGGRAVRGVWAAAVVLSLLVPLGALWPRARETPRTGVAVVLPAWLTPNVTPRRRVVRAAYAATSRPTRDWPHALAAL